LRSHASRISGLGPRALLVPHRVLAFDVTCPKWREKEEQMSRSKRWSAAENVSAIC